MLRGHTSRPRARRFDASVPQIPTLSNPQVPTPAVNTTCPYLRDHPKGRFPKPRPSPRGRERTTLGTGMALGEPHMTGRVRWWWLVVAGTAGVILGGFVALKF